MFPSSQRACPAGVILLLSSKSGDVDRTKELLRDCRRRRLSSSSSSSFSSLPVCGGGSGGGEDGVHVFPLLDPDATRDARGNNALHLAAIHGHAEVARLLVSAGASTEATVSRGATNEGLTPLRLAAERGHIATVRALLAAGADAAAKDLVDGATPLHAAAEAGHTAVVLELAGAGRVNLEARAVSGQTPLRWALSMGRTEAAAALLAVGADADAPDRRGECCLHTVAGLHSEDDGGGAGEEASPASLATLLLSAGATPNLVRGGGGDGSRRWRWSAPAPSPPTAAAKSSANGLRGGGGSGYGGVVSVGETPLHVASRESSVEVAKVLLLNGADPNIKTSPEEGGFSPLHCAAAPGNEESRGAIVRALLEAGAVIDAAAADGMTPLKLACANAAVGCVRELLRWGADDPSCVPCGSPPTPGGRRLPPSSPPSPSPSPSHPPHADLAAPSPLSPSAPVSVLGAVGDDDLAWHPAAAPHTAAIALDAGDDDNLGNLVGSRVPASARDAEDCQAILRMLRAAPFDRAWRRRGWLVMLHARAIEAATTTAAAAATGGSAADACAAAAAAAEKRLLYSPLLPPLPPTTTTSKRARLVHAGDQVEESSRSRGEEDDSTTLRGVVSLLFAVDGDQSVLRRVIEWL